MRKRGIWWAAVAVAQVAALAIVGPCEAADSPPSPRVLWVTDLYEPVNDPDDHYDLAVGMASAASPSMVVLDDHLGRQTGAAPAVTDLAEVAGEAAPAVVLDSQIRRQARMLRRSPDRSVRIVSLGALTAVADLIEKRRPLVERKVASVLVVAGDAAVGAPVEYNVAQDPDAFLAVMTSGVPVRWVPCFDGGLWQVGTSSYTVTTDAELLDGVDPEVRAWFDRYIGHRYGTRNLWASGLLVEAPEGAQWLRRVVRFDDAGSVSNTGRRAVVRQLVVHDRELFETWMVETTADALQSLN